MLVLLMHYRCDCRCLMCDIWRVVEQSPSLSEPLLSSLTKSISHLGVEELVLSGGEATLHPKLWPFVQQVRQQGTRITLLSTGVSLERLAEKIASHIDLLILSLDGDEATHDRIRGIPGAWQRLQRGIRKLRSVAPDLPVQGRSVIHRENFRVLPLLIDSARELGLDQVSLLPADVTETAFNRREWDDGRVQQLALDEAETIEFRSILERTFRTHRDAFDSGFVAESPRRLRQLVQYYRALLGLEEWPRVRCNAPSVSAVVAADGQVKPCFFLPSYPGNVNLTSLEQVLGTEQASYYREAIEPSVHPTCQRCVCTLYRPG
ncbi:MAG: radical SAM protein [Myxococcota bacterium]|nr:radical SAM protein [Myxococcota bacterium]